MKRTEKAFRLFTEKWVKGKGVSNSGGQIDEIESIIDAVNALLYANPGKPSPEMTVAGDVVGSDDKLGALLTAVLGNLLIRMNRISQDGGAKSIATFAGMLAEQADEYRNSSIWRTSPEPPISELNALKKRLIDVSCIAHELDYDCNQSSANKISKLARKAPLNKGISTASRRCRSLSKNRFQKILKKLETTLKDKGCNARCWLRPIDKFDTIHWPTNEVAILVEIVDFEKNSDCLQDALTTGEEYLKEKWRFRVVPVLNGFVLPDLAFLPSSDMTLPDVDFKKNWTEYIDLPFLSPEIVNSFDKAYAACVTVSNIIACCDLSNLHREEERVLALSIESFERNRDLFFDAAEHVVCEYIALAENYLYDIWDQVVNEYNANKTGSPVEEPYCLNFHLALAGQANDQMIELSSLRILMLQSMSEIYSASSSSSDQ